MNDKNKNVLKLWRNNVDEIKTYVNVPVYNFYRL